MAQGWLTALQTLAQKSAMLGPQYVVFEPVVGVNPPNLLLAYSKLALVNISSSVVAGNITVLDRIGNVKNILRTFVPAKSIQILNSSTLLLGSSGSIEWRPDLNWFAV